MKRVIALLMCLIFVLSFAGCGKDDTKTSAGLPVNVNELGNEYDTVDDMPDWTGDKLELTVWYGYGSNETYIGKTAKEDKFRDEIERVTGVRISETKSFDNGGSTGDTKIAKMVSTGNWPHIGMGLESSIAESLIEEGMLYDLTDLIPKYMPNYSKILDSHEAFRTQWDNAQNEKGDYALKRFHKRAFQFYDPDYSMEKYSKLIQPSDSREWIWVRDDILKMLYPEAKTQAEIKEIYMKNGEFTEADMKDVTIKSKEEFRELLEKIDALNLTEGGRKVWPFYTHAGEDNWDLLTMFGPTIEGCGVRNGIVSNFTYYDGKKDEMVSTAEQEWFKELCWFFNELVIDGLASKEALVDNRTAFDQKKSNGEYAIFYGNMIPPTDEQLKAAGKDFSYRRVMLDIPGDYDTFVRNDSSKSVFDNYNMYFFKSMDETQLEQTLRFLDFFYSEAGMKLANWGPKKAGLYEEDEDGNMRYTDKKFEAAQLYEGDQQVFIDYGIYSWPRIDYFIVPDGLNKYQPELVYGDNAERIQSDWTKYWNYSYIEPLPDFPYTNFGWAIYNFGSHSEHINAFWNARQSSEDAIKKLFTASNRKEFDKYYDAMLKKLRSNGLDEEGIKDMNRVLKEQCGDTYEDLKNWTTKK
ncbi:MAG: hypothetical protein IJ454_04925 [Clostridia bacterium]|nr:hypothetical protein [Clostridia bacterium]